MSGVPSDNAEIRRNLAAQWPFTRSPTCRRLAPDFALFPLAIGFDHMLSPGAHQKARSRPLPAYRAGPTRGGLRLPSQDGFARRATMGFVARRPGGFLIEPRQEKAPAPFRPVPQCDRMRYHLLLGARSAHVRRA